MKPSLRLLPPFLFLFAFNQCGFKNITTQASARMFYNATPAIDQESDLELARSASLSSLKVLEGLYLQSPKNTQVLLLLTRAYSGFAYGFTENEILTYRGVDAAKAEAAETRAKLFYARAKRYGVELLSLNSGFAKALTGNTESFERALQGFGKKDIEGLFWTAFAWGSHLNANRDSIEAVSELPRVEAMMRRVLELDENYYYGAPYLFLGAYYGGRPKMLGGDPERAREHFEKAIAIGGGKYLMSQVSMAQFYAVQMQDAGLYQKLLQEVSSADPAVLPEQRLSNEIAKARAEILLKRKDALFNPAASK